jgi:hypothetical protein
MENLLYFADLPFQQKTAFFVMNKKRFFTRIKGHI